MLRIASPLARRLPSAVALALLAACGGDAVTHPISPADATLERASMRRRESGARLFERYVAIGTSVSMGWRSDGVIAAFQESSWPADLSRMAGRSMTVPRIALPGCGAPLVAPLLAGFRLSGEPAQTPFLQRVCAPNEPDVVLPTQNLAITGALTVEALLATPEHPDSVYARLYSRVLPPGLSQVTAMLAQQPTLVSVELGANEIIGASDGAYVPGRTVVPVPVWALQYRQVLDNVQRATSRALLVGLPTRALDFPGLRLGDELWAARATFVPFNVAVSSDCRGSANALFVPVIVTTAVRTGVFNALHHLGRYRLSCKDSPALAPNGSVIRDFVLSPTDLALVDRQLTEMDQLIRTEAVQRGFAYYTLGALYDDVNHKARFNAITLVTAQAPYGPYFSLDGVHPSARGAQVLAEAAARALDERYEAGIGPRATLTAARSTESSVPPISDR